MSSQGDPSAALLRAVGTDVLRSVVSVVVETWAVVIYTVLVIKAGMILFERKRRRNKLVVVTLAIVIVMYIMNCTLWIIDLHNIVEELTITLVSDSPGSLEQRIALSGSRSGRLDIVEDVVYAYMTVLGDAIVLSRVWAFWADGNDRYALVFPFGAYLASIILSGLVTFCAAQPDADIVAGGFLHPDFCENIQWSSYLGQVATAGISTALIGYKSWKHRRLVQSYLGDGVVHKSSVYRAMMIILDTGVVYTLVFLAEAITGAPKLNPHILARPTLSFALEIYQFTTSSIVGIYPTAIVILVHTQCTLLDSHGNTTISTIDFQHGRSRQSTEGTGGRNSLPNASKVRRREPPAEVGLRELDSFGSRPPEEKLEFSADTKEPAFLDVSQDNVNV